MLTRREGSGYEIDYEVASLSAVAGGTKVMPPEYLDGSSGIAPAFRDYCLPLVGELPRPGRFVPAPVEPRLR